MQLPYAIINFLLNKNEDDFVPFISLKFSKKSNYITIDFHHLFTAAGFLKNTSPSLRSLLQHSWKWNLPWQTLFLYLNTKNPIFKYKKSLWLLPQHSWKWNFPCQPLFLKSDSVWLSLSTLWKPKTVTQLSDFIW